MSPSRTRLVRYYALLPVLGAYLVLFLIGNGQPDMWQLVAMLAFYCALGQAFNLFLGMTGYVDFGYVAFAGVGTYGMAISISHLSAVEGIGFWAIAIGLLLGATMATLLSLAVGAVALRLRGAYFAIATIGVNEGFRYFVEGARIWNGSDGIIFSRDLRLIFGRETGTALSTFWADVLVLLIAALAGVVTLLFMHSKIGYALTALRADEDAAKVMGINVTKYKIMAFITSAVFAGLLGATAWALKLTYVYPPDVFEIHYTVEAIVIVMLGGVGTLLGPLVGGLVYGLSKYWLAVTLPGFQLLIFAPLLLVIVVLFPEGLVGVLKKKIGNRPLGKFIV